MNVVEEKESPDKLANTLSEKILIVCIAIKRGSLFDTYRQKGKARP